MFLSNPPTLPSNINHESVIRIRTFSKDPNLAGYRLGYILAVPSIIARLRALAPVLYGNPNVMGLRAILTEFLIKNGKLHDPNYTETSIRNYSLIKEARDYLYARLSKHPLVDAIILPDACYYMLARFHFSGGSRAFSEILLQSELLDVVPGTVFGLPENEAWVRMCFARDKAFLDKAISKLDKVISLKQVA
jgi:aspartate/methionine/tyrosine aminotransferase